MQIIDAVYEKDPNGATLAFADMMKKQIVMPAHMMDDGEHKGKTGRTLFAVSAISSLAEAESVLIYTLPIAFPPVENHRVACSGHPDAYA